MSLTTTTEEIEIPLWEKFHDTIQDNKNIITVVSVCTGILYGLYTLNSTQSIIGNKIEKLAERVKEMDLEIAKIDIFIRNRHRVKRI